MTYTSRDLLNEFGRLMHTFKKTRLFCCFETFSRILGTAAKARADAVDLPINTEGRADQLPNC